MGSGLMKHYRSKGWPRAMAFYRPRRPFGGGEAADGRWLPVPWLNAATTDRADTDWTAFRSGGLANAHTRGCMVCGLAIRGPVFLCAQDGGKATSGYGCHARCAALAVRFCPNLQAIAENGVVAWRYDGEGIGVTLLGAEEPGRLELTYGDHDRVDESCVPLTRAGLLRAVRNERESDLLPQ